MQATPAAAPAAQTTDNPRIADVIEATGEVFEFVKTAPDTVSASVEQAAEPQQ